VEQEVTRLIFLRNPASVVAIALFLMAAVSLALFGRTYLRAAGWRRGAVLLCLRSISLVVLLAMLMEPSLLAFEPTTVQLPASYTEKEVRVVPASRLDGLLPPLAALPAPVPPEVRDAAIESVSAPPVAFLKSGCTVTVTVSNRWKEQEGEIAVHRLTRDGPVEVARVRTVLAPGTQPVAVEVVPDLAGRLAFAASLHGFSGNTDPANDTMPFGLTVARDVVRVLHIAGAPSWDVRFLRQFLTTLPGIELVSFYLLVEAQDFAPHGADELSLIPFPTDELFLQEIGNFDLVIAQNFPLGTYFQLREEHLRKLVSYVEEGGGLLFLGGDRALASSEIQDTAVEPILPMDPMPEDPTRLYDDTPRRFALTELGAVHPIFSPSIEEASLDVPAGLPLLSGINRTGAVRPSAQVLATAGEGPDELPVLLCTSYGKGRVLVAATDSLWRWAFPPSAADDSRTLYRRVFQNAVAWLTRDPRMEEVYLSERHVPVEEGSETEITACWRGTADAPAKATMNADWLDAGGRSPALHVEVPLAFAADRCASFTLPPARPGAWVLAASSPDRADTSGGAIVAVGRKAPTARQRLVERASGLLSMRFLPWVLDPKFTASLGIRELPIQKPVITPLWGHPAFFILLIAAVAAEWILRRRWGYL
jgi:uncharacterized membrane protein